RLPASPDEVSASYIAMVDETLRDIVGLLLTAKTGVLYFCRAGKDRTGVVSALLLRRLGMPRDYIVRDYMESGSNLAPLLLEYARQSPDVDLEVITPKRRYIADFLDSM
ncbi:MAG: tyrosine-protein phosphatase, partial [Clostridia bacterium]|nr:tyrosine-protein phosphatase [Clostridia bacterium]